MVAVLAGLAWHGYGKYTARTALHGEVSDSFEEEADVSRSTSFKCDGRTHCSQMTSCAEATFFIRNCPGTQMDGDNDGVPCESQWCR